MDHLWIFLKNKKQKRNNESYQKNDNRCFEYAVTVALNQEIKKQEKILKKIKLDFFKVNITRKE